MAYVVGGREGDISPFEDANGEPVSVKLNSSGQIPFIGVATAGGPVAAGAVPTGNPLDVAWDGTDTRRLLTDVNGDLVVVGSTTVGSAPATKPLDIAVDSSGNQRRLLANTSGRLAVCLATSYSDVNYAGPYGFSYESDAGTNGRSLAVVNALYRNGAFYWQRTLGLISSSNLPGITSTTMTGAGTTALWTPNSGKKFRLMKYRILIPGDTYLAAAGRLVIRFYDASTDLGIWHSILLPAAAGTTPMLWDSGLCDLGNGYLSSTANNALGVNLSAAVTNGINVQVFGNEE